MSESLSVTRPDIDLAGERWPGGSPVLVLLHEGVADRRGWRQTAQVLAPGLTVVAYDQRGYGETPPSPGPFSHVDDLLAVLNQVADGPAWLVGTAVSGAPQPYLEDPAEVAQLIRQAVTTA